MTAELWSELERIFTQVIQNLKQKLDSLIFKEGGNFEMHVVFFLSIGGKLAKYDTEISEPEKTSEMLRSLPPSFALLAIVSCLHELSFEKVVKVDQAELSRRSNLHNPQSQYK